MTNRATQLQLEQKAEQRQNWKNLLSTINRVLIATAVLGAGFWLIVLFFVQQTTPMLVFALSTVFALLSGLSSLVLRVNRAGYLEAATAISILNQLITIALGTAMLGTNSGVISLFFLPPVLVSLLGLSSTIMAATTFLSIMFIALLVGLQGSGVIKPTLDIAKELPVANIILWAISLVMILVGLIVFKRQLQKALEITNQRAAQLSQLTSQLNNVVQFGSTLSHDLSGVTHEINSTSRQQASSASEQAASIVQATSSLEELGETAKHIARNSTQVATAAGQSLKLAHEVETSSELVNALTESGQQSIEGVINAVEAVRSRIEALAQRLLSLTERSKEIGNIIDLIRTFADDTHLLAINAAIESADGKSSSNDGGRRFGVIASEVKNLADRSLEAAEDVQKVIMEVQGAIATAVLAAEEGKKETIRAVNQAYTSRQVINDLSNSVKTAVGNASQIVSANGQVGHLLEEVNLATQQQGSASEQVVLTMHSIREVAQESAQAMSQLSLAVAKMNERVSELNDVLARNSTDFDLPRSGPDSKRDNSSTENIISPNVNTRQTLVGN